ncbi:unnamed protein product [Hymenolepis diminuta]|uniref:GPI ethanolamine phosphate transferase 1 n=1 Tax=Hymenolepis diminuta TaxID=6216 RepID=A0A158QFJ4_HYMDI|nr:unnamed protein product [Hymenolepis diminuta]
MTASRLRSVLSVVLYILLFYSIFDVYYTSPLVHRGSYERPSVPNLVKTVVFIVADGLRYDRLYTEDMEDTPTLRRLMRNEGIWGFSHTRVPTESRPGWQANAVEFDSIFNRSYRAFAWGGPDVVPMFQPLNRVGDERVKIESYPHEMLDFTAENLTQVDDWVVDKFADFMANSSHLLHSTSAESEDVNDGFRKGNFLFLHLSAADQMGHTKKPGSEEYLELVRHLDKNIARILSIFEQHLEISQDSAFIFTADHGMTDWGSHGAGSDHETITPLIVWGKHIPRPASPFKLADLSPTTKSFSRIDIRQADLCPLIACLLGVPIPAHSIGELPLELLDLDPSLKVGLIRENALHALKQLHLWGFFHRILLSLGGILLGLWSYLDPTFITLQNRTILQRLWLVSCCILAIFPSLPVVGSHFSPTLVLCSSICISSAALAFLKVFLKKSDSSASWLTKANDLLVFESAFSGLLVFLVRNLVDWSIPVPILIHVVFFVIYAFFGTGNIASVNTFDPVSVYCFITVLSPSIMGALLIFKIICPIVVVGTSYALLGYVKPNTSAASSRQEITVLMIIANFLAVHFFAMLRDEGSWLDIGESISHYVIAMSIGLASVLLSYVGSWMLTPPWMSRRNDTKLS